MIKYFLLGLLLLSSSATPISILQEADFLQLREDIKGSFMKGFFEGLVKDPSTSSTNPCLLQIATTDKNSEELRKAFLSISNAHTLLEFFPKMRLFADSYNQEIAVCNYPALLTLVTTALKLDNLGEYMIRYLVGANEINPWYNDAITNCDMGQYEACGFSVGNIFRKLTLFGI
jgi:hypothetical protein